MWLKWLNILGMVLQFLSFWCAAPELLGEATMKRLEVGMTRLVTRLPVIIVFGSMLLYATATAGFGVYDGITAGRGEEPVIDINHYLVVLGLLMAIYVVFLFTYKRILAFLEQRLAQPLVHRLVASADARRNALVLGAVLLTVGFLMQLAVAFLV